MEDFDDFYDVYRPENYEYLLSDPEEDEPAPEPEVSEDPAPEPEASEDPAPEPEAPEEEPGEPEPEAPEEGTPAEPEAPPAEEAGDQVQDLIDAIGDLNETITGAVTQEPEAPPTGETGGGGGSGGGAAVVEPASVDLTPVVRVLERTNELLVQQEELLATQHNDLLQLQANVDFVFLAVAALIGVVLGAAVSFMLHDLWRA